MTTNDPSILDAQDDQRADSGLTARQEKALAALLDHPTIRDAARASQIGERTLYRWLAEDPRFKDAYAAVRRARLQQSIGRLQQTADDVVAALYQIVNDPDATSSSRVAAGKTLLTFLFKGVELNDLQQRLEALESGLAAQDPWQS